MLSLQSFTKNSSHGWGDLFVYNVRRSVLKVLLIDTVTSRGFLLA